MSIVTTSDFVYPYFLDTSGDNTLLQSIIDYVESEYLPLVLIEDLSEKKAMILGFVYAFYCSEQLRMNTSIGNVNINTDNATKDGHISNAYAIYNTSVILFNEYVIDKANTLRMYNEFGL